MKMFRRSRRVIAVDIGTSAIKIMAATIKPEGMLVDAVLHAPLSYGVLVDGQIQDRQVVTQELERIDSLLAISDAHWSTAIRSVRDVIVKRLRVQRLGHDEALAEVRLKLAALLKPMRGRLGTKDDLIILDDAQASASMMEIIYYAGAMEKIEDLQAVFSDAAVNLRSIDVDAFALRNALYASMGYLGWSEGADPQIDDAPRGVDLILDAGEGRGVAVVLEGGHIQVARQIPSLSSLKLTSIIDKVAAAPGPDARDLHHVDLMGLHRAALGTYIDDVVLDIQNVLGAMEPARIHLTGGLAMASAVQSLLSERLDRPVSVLDPFTGANPLQLGPSVDPGNVDMGPMFALASGILVSL